MSLILYPAGTAVYTNNGLGILSDVIDCTVTAELGSPPNLELTYPVGGLHAADIAPQTIITCPAEPGGTPQPFVVYDISRPLFGKISVRAMHRAAYDLAGIVCAPFAADTITGALTAMVQAATTDCPYTFTTNKAVAAHMESAVPASIYSLLGGNRGSLLDVYGGEWTFDGYNVSLRDRVGIDRGTPIYYGVNLRTLEQDAACSKCYTGVYPFWAGSEGGSLVQLDPPVIYAEGEYTYTRILPLDLSLDFEQQPTVEELRARAERYMTDNSIGVPDVSLTIKTLPLELSLGDTVTVDFETMSISATARVVAGKYLPLTDRWAEVTIGKAKPSFAKMAAQQQRQLAEVPTTPTINALIQSAAERVLGVKGGSLRLLDTDQDGEPDTLYIADDPDPTQAQKVWRFNFEGWAASSNGYAGPYAMAATLEDGLMAEFVTAAQLTAGYIQSADGQSFIIDLTNNSLQIKGSTGQPVDVVDTLEATSGAYMHAENLWYLASPNAAAPSKPSTYINTVTSLPGAWSLLKPDVIANYKYYSCQQYQKVDGSWGWTDVRVDSTDTRLAAWARQNNATFIDGGHIYTGSIVTEKLSAKSIDINGVALKGSIFHYIGAIDVGGGGGEAAVNSPYEYSQFVLVAQGGYNAVTFGTAVGITGKGGQLLVGYPRAQSLFDLSGLQGYEVAADVYAIAGTRQFQIVRSGTSSGGGGGDDIYDEPIIGYAVDDEPSAQAEGGVTYTISLSPSFFSCSDGSVRNADNDTLQHIDVYGVS